MSPWEIRRIKSEVMKSRTQIIDAEARIKKLEALNMELTLCHNNEIKALEENLLQERAKVKYLVDPGFTAHTAYSNVPVFFFSLSLSGFRIGK